MNAKRSDATVLIVGAGPAGLEAASALGKRGYRVTLADDGMELGGRLHREARLPGMSEYIRVRDYRAQQFYKLENVKVYLESRLNAKEILAFGADHVALATGAKWRRDRFDGETYVNIVADGSNAKIFTPDDIMDGMLPNGPTIVYDEDCYYMGGVIAEKLKIAGIDVTLCTPSEAVSEWAAKTSERWRIRAHLMKLDIKIKLAHALTNFDGKSATLTCQFTGNENQVHATSIVMVTQRTPRDDLYHKILALAKNHTKKIPFTLTRIGDCEAPAIVAAATYAGHRYARQLEEDVDIDQPLKHDRVDVGEAGVKFSESTNLGKDRN